MKVIAYDPYINETAAQELNVTPVTLEQLLKDSDLISVHCPLTKDTYHLIGKEEMTLLKPNAILVNTARGGTVIQFIHYIIIQILINQLICFIAAYFIRCISFHLYIRI